MLESVYTLTPQTLCKIGTDIEPSILELTDDVLSAQCELIEGGGADAYPDVVKSCLPLRSCVSCLPAYSSNG